MHAVIIIAFQRSILLENIFLRSNEYMIRATPKVAFPALTLARHTEH